MSIKQSRKAAILEELHADTRTNQDAAERLAMSVRQVQRLKKAFAEKGHSCLVHSNIGKQSTRRIADEVREMIETKAIEEYRGTSWQHMSELFEEQERKCAVFSSAWLCCIIYVLAFFRIFDQQIPSERKKQECSE